MALLIIKILKLLGVKKNSVNLLKPTKIVTVGKESYHNGNFTIRGNQAISIGSYCAFGRNISLITEYHDTNFIAIQGTVFKKKFSIPHPGTSVSPPNKERTKGGINIGSDVWIGDGCYILSGVTIGHGACIAANSVVTKNIEPYAVYAGSPARKIKMRFNNDVINLLLNIKWWNWEDKKITSNKTLFTTDLNKTPLETIKQSIR